MHPLLHVGRRARLWLLGDARNVSWNLSAKFPIADAECVSSAGLEP